MATGGRLTVVGTGIGFRQQLIPAAEVAIAAADLVLHQIDDPLTAEWLHGLNAATAPVVEPDVDDNVLSSVAYEAMAKQVAHAVMSGQHVCFVTYGHPGVYQHAAHRSVELVRAAGLEATMLPGISALDCLIADLGVDIAEGCQILDATALVLQDKSLDPTSALVVFQIGIFGNPYYGAEHAVSLAMFADRLRETFGAEHTAILYEAPLRSADAPKVTHVPIAKLESASVTPRTLLYLAPSISPEADVIAAAELASRLAERR